MISVPRGNGAGAQNTAGGLDYAGAQAAEHVTVPELVMPVAAVIAPVASAVRCQGRCSGVTCSAAGGANGAAGANGAKASAD